MSWRWARGDALICRVVSACKCTLGPNMILDRAFKSISTFTAKHRDIHPSTILFCLLCSHVDIDTSILFQTALLSTCPTIPTSWPQVAELSSLKCHIRHDVKCCTSSTAHSVYQNFLLCIMLSTIAGVWFVCLKKPHFHNCCYVMTVKAGSGYIVLSYWRVSRVCFRAVSHRLQTKKSMAGHEARTNPSVTRLRIELRTFSV